MTHSATARSVLGAATMKRPSTLFMFVVLASVLVLACEGQTTVIAPDPACNEGAGGQAPETRLRDYWNGYADGKRVLDPVLLWDSERAEPCSFTRIAGGAAYCLPAFAWNNKPAWFSDALCSQPVAIVNDCLDLPRYIRDDSAMVWQTCAPASLQSLRPLADPLPKDAVLYQQIGADCVEMVDALGANVAIPMGEPIPLSAFVSGVEGP